MESLSAMSVRSKIMDNNYKVADNVEGYKIDDDHFVLLKNTPHKVYYYKCDVLISSFLATRYKSGLVAQ